MYEDVEIDAGQRTGIKRVPLGLYTFDLALSSKDGRIGVPLRTMIEIAGKTHVGKSTTAYYMAGMLSSLPTNDGQIEICDLEGLDVDYLKYAIGVSRFKGKVHLIDSVDKGKIRQHPAMAQELLKAMNSNPKISIALLDSVGAFVPTAESEGDIGEAFMGRRAFNLAQFARKATEYLVNKPEPCNVIYVNHTHSVIGGQGHTTAGGDTLKYLTAIRLNLWQKEVVKFGTEDKEYIAGYRVAGTVEKLKFGGKGKKFTLVIIPEYGVSKELTAVYDASDLGLIDRKTVVKVDGKSIGYMSTLFKHASEDNLKVFEPIMEKIEKEKEKHVLGDSKVYEETE